MKFTSVNRSHRRLGCLTALCATLFWVLPAGADSGFIGNARVVVNESGTDTLASIVVHLKCRTQMLHSEPTGQGDRLRIFLEPTSICDGVSPLIVNSSSRIRPSNADDARLTELEYDGESAGGPVLTLVFSESVRFTVEAQEADFNIIVHVRRSTSADLAVATKQPAEFVEHRQVARPQTDAPDYVVNLASFQRVPTVADVGDIEIKDGQRVFYSEALVNRALWYRLRLGTFDDAALAKQALDAVAKQFPGAWIDRLESDASETLLVSSSQTKVQAEAPKLDIPDSKVDVLMEDARRTLIAGDTSRAIQIYTKVLQQPDGSRHVDAQEYLALAREKNGQLAHAKAEYQRYLSLYPEAEGAARVSQRLAALLASTRPANPEVGVDKQQSNARRASQSDWRIQTYFSQYYRRDVNQPDERDDIVSQSALYSDVNFDARRRGDRLDFSSRISLGYRNDFLDTRSSTNSNNSTRISYAYADLADTATGLRGRIGRQSQNTGGVLGRFDGLMLGYQFSEKLLLNSVFGKPAYSSSGGIDSERTFYGVSANYGPIVDAIDLGLFYIQQDIKGIRDRQAVGGEFRYFGPRQSLWGIVDYDLHFGELASAFLQGSWRFDSRLALHAMANRRGSPFLSTGNAIIGQPVTSFAELAEIFSDDELTELGRDRTASSTNYSLGISYPLTPNFQFNADAGRSTIEATPDSGGIFGVPASEYDYYSGSLLMSSLIKEGDVSIVGVRYSNSSTSKVTSFNIDSRYPLGRSWRINARLRVDHRQITSNDSEQWLITPGIRIFYRRSQKFRIELEAGKLFSQQESTVSSQDRESYFINVGYQVFF